MRGPDRDSAFDKLCSFASFMHNKAHNKLPKMISNYIKGDSINVIGFE